MKTRRRKRKEGLSLSMWRVQKKKQPGRARRHGKLRREEEAGKKK